jgi:predicted XRE-type DNA-binding protein
MGPVPANLVALRAQSGSTPNGAEYPVNGPAFEVSGGNVFADLGFAEPEEELAHAELAHRIATTIEDRGLTPEAAAMLMGIDPSEVAALMRGHLDAFTLERLARYLIAMGNDVEIVVFPSGETGHLRVRVGR